jgi:hypothetical protein
VENARFERVFFQNPHESITLATSLGYLKQYCTFPLMLRKAMRTEKNRTFNILREILL